MGLIQPGHLILILVIALVIVGPGKIGDLGGALGTAVRDFRKAAEDVQSGIDGKPTEAKAPEKKPEA